MAHRNRVLQSIETDDGGRCVDLFVRADGTFGFEEYRRDSEDGLGWFPIGGYASVVFVTPSAARTAALAAITWLTAVVNGP